ncbi:hypothetical protein PANT_22c00007 [Moesziomyces antarcticus T-34]|uniref:Uncharacterized protein n=1 Tax=Pseudozyma antarctica (strain T-34) TaxID=1151754 RepID=M9LS80_PSEA3|nr:hypothetical protein PANT_22c00007 [Moesziomyces antarcticus T-34]
MCLTPLSSGSVQPSEAVATEAGPVLSAQPTLQPRVSSAVTAAVGTDVWLSRIARWGLGEPVELQLHPSFFVACCWWLLLPPPPSEHGPASCLPDLQPGPRPTCILKLGPIALAARRFDHLAHPSHLPPFSSSLHPQAHPQPQPQSQSLQKPPPASIVSHYYHPSDTQIEHIGSFRTHFIISTRSLVHLRFRRHDPCAPPTNHALATTAQHGRSTPSSLGMLHAATMHLQR